MIVTTMMLIFAQAIPTLAAIERLSSEIAGDVALAGRDHNPILEIVVPKVTGPEPAGFVELQMVERALPMVGGCVRRRWTVNFYRAATATANDTKLSDAHATTEVALRRATGCQSNSYVHLNGGLDATQAITALTQLNNIRRGQVKAKFSCSDSTSSNLCAMPRAMPSELAKIIPWAVMREGEATTFWLVDRGQTVTEVRYSGVFPNRIIVKRSTPPPF